MVLPNPDVAFPAIQNTHPRSDTLFRERPVLVYWEMTQACDLACRHCRAEAQPCPLPLELDTAESRALLRDLTEFGTPLPHLVMTGGDPFKRRDLFPLLIYARSLGLPVSLAPSATPLATRESLRRARDLGVTGLSLSLDGSTPERHDELRRVPGCFERTVELMREVHDLGLPLQINTLVTRETLPDLMPIARLLTGFSIARWSLFFLIHVGRGKTLEPITPAETERLFHDLYRLRKRVPFAIKTTEAMHYRRVAFRSMVRDGWDEDEIRRSDVGRGFGIRDGNGILFISSTGSVFPSGFLPLSVGNVREKSPVELYRNSRLFRDLQEPEKLRGKCGRCEYRYYCGGSRARAYAATGDPLEADPLCLWEPKRDKVYL